VKEKPGEGLGRLSHHPPRPNLAQGDANRSSQIYGGEQSSEQQNWCAVSALNPSGSFLSFPRLYPKTESESEVASGRSAGGAAPPACLFVDGRCSPRVSVPLSSGFAAVPLAWPTCTTLGLSLAIGSAVGSPSQTPTEVRSGEQRAQGESHCLRS
jgi:hypothetical protein